MYEYEASYHPLERHICIDMIAWYTYDAYVLGNCDPKFGCFGRIQIGAFVLGVSAFVSSLSVLIAYITVNKAVGLVFSNATISTTAIVGLVLGIFTDVVLPSLGESLILGMVSWLAISFVVGSIAYLMQRNITITSS